MSADEMPLSPMTKRDASASAAALPRKRSNEAVGSKAYFDDESQKGASAQPSTGSRKRRNSSDSATIVMKQPSTEGRVEQPQVIETPSQQVPPSGQGNITAPATTAKLQGKVSRAKNTAEAQPELSYDQGDEDINSESGTDSSDLVPEHNMEGFDWDELFERYHTKMHEVEHRQQHLMTEFNCLMNYFATWAMVGSTKEVNRSFKRLKTQTALVQHEEEALEKKRKHYIQVVDAFKSALELLRDQ